MVPSADKSSPTTDDDGFVGLRAAAEELGVHYMTAYRYVRLGTLPAEKADGTWQVRISDLRALTQRDQPTPGPGGVRWEPYRTRLHDRLVAGDEPGAWSVVERALVSGATAPEIHLEMIVPVLRDIGGKWERGELTVAEEHRASAVAARLISRLGPSFARRGRKRGTVVIGAAAGDHHALPIAILGDIIRNESLAVVDLGPNTPPESFVQTAATLDDLVAVAISVGSDTTAPAARTTAQLLHDQIPGVRVFIGGPAVTDAGTAQTLGADEFGTTAREVADRCLELARDRRTR